MLSGSAPVQRVRCAAGEKKLKRREDKGGEADHCVSTLLSGVDRPHIVKPIFDETC